VWLGHKVRGGPTIYITAEEPKSEIHIRLVKIMAPIAVPSSAHKLTFISCATGNAALVRFDRNGKMTSTDLFKRVARLVRDQRAKLLVLDAAADVFDGNENDRGQVRNFIGLLRHLALECDCAILLLTHPSMEGLRSGRGHSGSTHWHNAVRSRFYLTTPNVGDPDLRKLEHVKSNRGPRAKPIMLRWKDGYFVVDDASGGGDHLTLAHAKLKFLNLLAQFDAAGLVVSHMPGHAYAPKLFAEDERAGGITKELFRRAMNSLLSDKRLRVEESGPPSRKRHRLTAVPAH
jgi:RecA-family ATPase